MNTHRVTKVSANHFNEIMMAVTTWGKVDIAIQTQAMALCVRRRLPVEKLKSNGEYRFIRGDIYPLGGNIGAQHIESISFLDDEKVLEPTCAIAFFDHFGSCIFKVLPKKDEQQHLNPEQREYFRTLRDRIAGQQEHGCCSLSKKRT